MRKIKSKRQKQTNRMISHVQIGLTEKVVKELQDRSLEKRSNAARLVQNDIEECVVKNDLNSIQNRIRFFD